MIKIDYEKTGKVITSLHAYGHANYDEQSKDIICSAVSAIMLGGLNALSQIDHFTIKVNDGDVEIKANQQIGEHDQIVLETMLIQLTGIKDNYSKFITIKRKE